VVRAGDAIGSAVSATVWSAVGSAILVDVSPAKGGKAGMQYVMKGGDVCWVRHTPPWPADDREPKHSAGATPDFGRSSASACGEGIAPEGISAYKAREPLRTEHRARQGHDG
jgi:hypothetical protein